MQPVDAKAISPIPENVAKLFENLEALRARHTNVDIAIGGNRPLFERVRAGFQTGQFGVYKPRLASVAWYGSSTPILGQNAEKITQEYMDFGINCAQNKVRLVFGAGVYRDGKVSVMGAAPLGCMQAGGEVIGVTTKQIAGWEPPLGHPNVTNYVKLGLTKANALFRRINFMQRKSDAFVIAPGGLGTIYEHTRAGNDQYMVHTRSKKPIIFLNTATDNSPKGFWRPTFKQYLNLWKDGFSSPFKIGNKGLMITNTHVAHETQDLWDIMVGAYKYGVGTGQIKLPKWKIIANVMIEHLNAVMKLVLRLKGVRV